MKKMRFLFWLLAVVPFLALASEMSGDAGSGFGAVLAIVFALVALVIFGVPLFVIMGLVTALCFYFFLGYDSFDRFQLFVVNIAGITDKNVLLAIPFFVVSGAIMSAGSIALRLVELARALVGWVPGGLAVATIFACVFYAAISGSSPVTVIAIGSVMLPALLKAGYSEKFSLGLLTSAGSLGIVIPPSIPMLVYALVAGNVAPVDVKDMFLAGVVPGLLLAGLLAAYAVWNGIKEKQPTQPFDIKEVARTLKDGIWALGLPIVILGGIYTVVTPTEAAAVSVVYALLVELFIHKSLTWKKLSGALLESGVSMGALLMIMALSFSLNLFFVEQQVPQLAVEWIEKQQLTPVQFVLALNVLLLFVGALMDSISAILVLAPLLAPIGYALGIDLVHLGVIFIINLEIGYLTPPVGMNLFVASSVFKKPLSVVIRGSLPYIGLLLVGLLLMTYVPTLSLGPVNVLLRDQPAYVAFPEAKKPSEKASDTAADQGAPQAPADGPRVKTIQEMMEEARRRKALEATQQADGE